MDHCVDPIESANQPVAVPHIPEEEPELRIEMLRKL
jgi:hypothetical protein